MTGHAVGVATKVFDLVEIFVEFYLSSFIKPFVAFHEKFYSSLNKTLRSILDSKKDKIPEWFTANFITYFRTLLVIPCLLLLAWGQTLLPSAIVILVDFGDFLDGVVARFWVDVRKEQEEAAASKDSPSSPTASDDESFGRWNRSEEFGLTNPISHYNISKFFFFRHSWLYRRGPIYWFAAFANILAGSSSQPHLWRFR